MPVSESDPRIFFAAERTLLAWLRTSITVMAFGFVIARFGLFLELISLQAAHARSHVYSGFSAVLGIILVLAGTLAAFIMAAQHRRFISALPPGDLPRSYAGTFAIASGIFIAVIGLILTAYLIISEL